MKILTDAVKQMLNALAYEHVGENMSMKQKAQVLVANDNVAAEVHVPTKARAKSNVRKVALYMGSELPSEVMEYVIETSTSLKHELTVLTFQSKNSALSLLEPYQQVLEQSGVQMELVTLSGDPVSGMARYLRRHSEVAFLACKDSGYLGRSYLKGTQSKNALPVPVVVVTTAGAVANDQVERTGSKTKANVA